MREALRFKGKIISATVSRQADKWFVSITMDTQDIPPQCENQAVVGVDLGVNRLATLSDETGVEGVKPHRMLLSYVNGQMEVEEIIWSVLSSHA